MSIRTPRDEGLTQVKSSFGFAPNLMEGIVERNPAVSAAYHGASAALEGGLLSGIEQQVVMPAVSAFNDRNYCGAGHRTAVKQMGVAQSELELDQQKQGTALLADIVTVRASMVYAHEVASAAVLAKDMKAKTS